MANIVTVDDHGAIPIPADIRAERGWRPGDRPTIERDGHAVTLRRDATPGMVPLSLGAAASLALAIDRDAAVVTADPAWRTLDIGVEVVSVR